jgi:hypothetical protein
MPGSPKKRAKAEAAERAKNMAAGIAEQQHPEPGAGQPTSAAPNLPAPAVTPIQGEVLSPEGAPEPTRTALKRAMRALAQEHAKDAIAVLVANMNNTQLAPDKRAAAANDLLAWGFGKPATEIEAGEGAQMIVIRKFGENPDG